MEAKQQFKLPLGVTSTIDVARAMRELNALNDFMTAAKVRTPGTPLQLPKLTRQLDELARLNNYNLTDENNRKELTARLNTVMGKSPVLHISFASEPSVKALERILSWLRENVHAQALLTVGLQPGIAAGCVLRTPNLLFDMSLRSYLKQQEPYVVQLIEEAANRVVKKEAVQAASPVTPPTTQPEKPTKVPTA